MSAEAPALLAGQGRLHGLDALRGFAALWVLLYHVVLRYPRFAWGLEMDVPLLPGVMPGFMQAELGIMPVLWFFLISGFVIALTLDRCGSGWAFVVHRATRIYPAYWATIALVVLFTDADAGLVPANLTMVQSYLGVPDLEGVFWSLAVEVLFYLYALAAFGAGLRRWVRPVALVWAVASLLAAVAVRLGYPVSWQVERLLLLRYGPLLAGGMMLYRLWRKEAPGWSAATLGVCAAGVAVRFHPVTAASCVVAAGVIAWSTRRGPRWLASWLVVRLGAGLGGISYALYLSHEAASFAVLDLFRAQGWVQGWRQGAGMGVAVAVSLLLAVLITHGIERPATALVREAWRRVRPVRA